MSKLFKVTINWGILKQHLAKELGDTPTDQEIRTWLQDAGFKPSGDDWIVREKDLGHLDPSEVTKLDDADAAS